MWTRLGARLKTDGEPLTIGGQRIFDKVIRFGLPEPGHHAPNPTEVSASSRSDIFSRKTVFFSRKTTSRSKIFLAKNDTHRPIPRTRAQTPPGAYMYSRALCGLGVVIHGYELIRKRPSLGPYSSSIPRALWWLWGGGAVSCERDTPVGAR